MKINYAPIMAVAVCSLLLFSISCKNKTAPDEQAPVKTDPVTAPVTPKPPSYNDLRKMALSATRTQLGLDTTVKRTTVHGIVMDWDIGDGIATTVAYATGDASTYLSNGGETIRGGAGENVTNAAKGWVKLAQKYLDKATKTDTASLPTKDMVYFYLVTNNGLYVGEERTVNFGKKSSAWLGLFVEGNKLLTELRKQETGMNSDTLR